MTARAGRPLAAVALGLLIVAAASAQSPPPVPRDYVSDGAGILTPDDRSRLNERLRRFDAETTNQVLVAIFPALPPLSSLEDFAVRTALAWRAGRGKLDNGVVLFVFVKDRKGRLEVGYGLEGALPDITAHRIIEEQITPRFRAGDYAGGIEAGVAAIIAATRGEYRATPPPAAAAETKQGQLSFVLAVLVEAFAPILASKLVLSCLFISVFAFVFAGSRWAHRWLDASSGSSGGYSSGGYSSGGGSDGGGRSFSGGGGSFGGGGASGSW